MSREHLRVTVLGCGTSTGVPVVGCACSVCTSDEPRNRRSRPGLCLEWRGRTVLVDTSADLRSQCLRAGIRRVDAVLFTHAHADHIHGLDDLRPFNFRHAAPIPCYGAPHTLERIEASFAYIFDGQPSEGGGKPSLELRRIEPGPFEIVLPEAESADGRLEADTLRVQAIPVWHGSLEVYAYRIGPFAYVTDTHHVPEASMARLRGVDDLILDALRYRPHATHFSVDQAVAVAASLGPRRTWLTHMNHDIDYRSPAAHLPPGVELAYDGLSFDVPLDS
ncbi:MAG: MBL fold metallo-hydrolase [Holophagales bacterium]|nr:MBL fold metallo-hydrolase [Holophagales bacterium]